MSFLIKKNEREEKIETELGVKMSNKDTIPSVGIERPITLEFLSKLVIFEPATVLMNGDSDENNEELTEKILIEKINAQEEEATSKHQKRFHEANVIRETCACNDCLKYREAIIQIYLEDLEYNILWERLQLIVRKYYDLIPEDPESIMEQRYRLLMSKNNTKWLSDGQVDSKKNIQISLGSNLPLTNDMTFILVFSMLYSRDPHQLFELLCIQVRSIVMAYAEKLKEIITYNEDGLTPTFDALELSTYVLDGYDKICNAAKTLTPLLFENQTGHLQQFSLTWLLLNKRMYHRWVSLEVQKFIPECLVKVKPDQLRTLFYVDKYGTTLRRYIEFDDELTLTAEMWRETWILIHDYHMSKKDLERRRRILTAHGILLAIKNSKPIVSGSQTSEGHVSVIEWLESRDKDEVWRNVLQHLRNKWIPCTDKRLTADIENDHCFRCNHALANHYLDCSCRTCIIAGGPTFTKYKEDQKHTFCAKCSFKTLDRDYLNYVMKIISEKEEECINVAEKRGKKFYDVLKDYAENTVAGKKQNNEVIYHLSWAVFKHLKDRVPYTINGLDLRHFCMFRTSPCHRVECRVATHVIVALYPIQLTKFLLKSYQPLYEEQRKKFFSIPSGNFTNYLHMLYEDNTLDTGVVASVFAECYLTDFTFPLEENIYPCFQNLFKTNGKDITLDLEWLECIHMSKILILKSKSNPQQKKNPSNECIAVADLKIQMENLKLNSPNCKAKASTSSLLLEKSKSASAIMELKAEQSPETSIVKIKECSGKDKPEKDITNEHLSEAIKLAVNRNLNKKLEAELRTLKKEHSVLKDMVRDLEQIKETEGKQIKSEKNGETCCSDHSDLLDGCRENHSSKMCHKGDGQCTCYYCTFFGHTECNHGRSNETRDRLRKRLHQIHNSKETKPINFKNMKTPPGLFKKVSPPSKALNVPSPKEISNIPQSLPSPITKPLPTTSNIHPIVSSKLLSVKSELVIQPPKQQKSIVKTNSLTEEIENRLNLKNLLTSCDSTPTSSIRRDSSSCGTVDGCSRLEDILQFIEGASLLKKSNGDPDKKAAKRAKQKQKKQDQKKMEELDGLKKVFHEQYSQEISMKNELRTLKSVRRKDKKKIAEIDMNLKRITRTKSKTESAICEIICEIREHNEDFKYNYMPPKEQKPKQSTKSITNTGNNNTPKQQREPLQQQQLQFSSPNQNVSTQFLSSMSNLTIGHKSQQPNCEISLDPAKRMVTIRRINLPHAEPQVTVTAKGTSPDKDQLLYTFINGQLVPASSLDPEVIQHLQPQMYTQPMLAQYQASLEQHSQRQQMYQQAVPTETRQNVTLPVNTTKVIKQEKVNSKTTKNNEPKTIQNKLPQNQQINLKASATKVIKDGKQSTQKVKQKIPEISDQKKNSKQNINEKNKVKLLENTPVDVKAKEKSVKEKKKIEHNQKINKPEIMIKRKMENTVVKNEKPVTKKVVEKVEHHQRAPTPHVYEYIDPEFKINKFGVLDTEEYSEPESIHSSVESPDKNIVVNSKTGKQKNKEKTKDNVKNKANSIMSSSNEHQTIKSKNKNQDLTNNSNKQSNSAKSQPIVIKDPEPILTKKQKKKLAQQEKAAKSKAEAPPLPNKVTVDKAVLRAEKMAKSLTKSMQRLHLNADTTIELVNDKDSSNDAKKMNSNISIMDQLNRGIKVEGLTLPPGITLTRVDPNTAEAVKAKKESIGRLCTPIQPQPAMEMNRPQLIMANPLNGPNSLMPGINMPQDHGGLIMVDTLNIAKSIQRNESVSDVNGKKVNKKNRRKTKNKKNETPPVVQHQQQQNGSISGTTSKQSKNKKDKIQQRQQQQQQSKMVTLRNPMFHAVSDAIRQQPLGRPQSVPGIGMDSPAAIIQNKNGMFTIRNPALHQALSGGVGNNFRQYSPSVYCPTDPPENFSYFSDNLAPGAPMSCNGSATGKFNSAIGSEIKNAQQMKQVPWQPQLNQHQTGSNQNSDIFNQHFHSHPTKSYSPFDTQGVSGYGFNSDFIGASSVSHNYYNSVNQNGNGCYGSGFAPGNGCNSLFSQSNHQCDDPHPAASLSNQHHYCDGIGAPNTKYDDLSFLQNLQPGQRLNSEVTIHNISESKFIRNQQPVQMSNVVEITRIPTTASCDKTNLAVGSNRNNIHAMPSTHKPQHQQRGGEMIGEYGDSIFAPNQKVNLNELESEERDIESFKRFNYYFEPPKNKPKVNLNVKDIVVNKRKSTSESPSMYLGTEENSVTSTPSIDEMYQHDNSSPSVQSTGGDVYSEESISSYGIGDNLGVIGSGIKAVMNGNTA